MSSNTNTTTKRGSTRMRQEGKKEVWISGQAHIKLKVRAAQNKKTISDEAEEILKKFFQMEDAKKDSVIV
jgi:hypothetical protein